MYRVVKMTNKVFALEIGDIDQIEDDFENIEAFVESGDVVMLSQNLDSVAELLKITEDDIKIVE